jgi:hypothetical protein
MPATVIDEPLGLACVFSDGTQKTFTLGAVNGPELARNLLAGLAELVHPHGTVDAAGTVGQYLLALRGMVNTLAGRGFVGGAGGLTRAQLAEYWMGTTIVREACTRRMLQAFDADTGALDPGARELAEGRAYNPQPFRRTLPPYQETEWTRLIETCQQVIDESFTAHKAALAAAARGQDPCVGGWNADNLRWLLARTGPSTLTEVSAHVGISVVTARRRGGFGQASTELFPHLDVTVAYLLLFGVHSGIVPDGIADLTVNDIDWAGDATILLGYVKGRTAAESLTLPKRAVRLLEQWLAHSALLRRSQPPTARRQLWLGVTREGSGAVSAGAVHRNVIRRWAQHHQVTDADGQPLKIHRHRIRTTHESMRDKRSWTGRGRATIDPNHSSRVEGDHYLTATTPTQRQAVEAIIEDAQHDLLRRAQPPVVIAEQDAVALVRDYPQLVAGLKLDDAVMADLVGGARDVFVAACADQLSGLHGPKGKPCPARPWVCLLCPLAVFAPRHAGNLLRLKAFFARQWRQMPAAQFMAVFGPYSDRIGQVLDCYEPTLLAAAASQVSDHDDELPLRPEELTA